ncbi:exopolysaccharide biosynthesis protein YbjH [Hydrogenispora ethanolica]|uniref:Exopolysaccharide biosynthesis protein YbjH n=1 Tax=Hydrogenispora ethanolica TaxID=1082276 RepID=A0A4R1RFP2_HYDET|nr:YjbH domain-containing protein [Hydrogenispora ethanolica]TCL64736.1 exopolysaccharide biosynthesis protein YbjH [Hydrogenispora ethanolica]
MKKALLFPVVLLILLATGTAALGAGLLGGTDLMVTPTADTLNSGDVSLGLNFAENDRTYGNLDFGVARDFELGVAVYDNPWDTDLTLRGKYRLLRETASQPALAIGIQDIGADEISPYLVISKTFDGGFRGYLGAGGGSFDGLFAGLSKNFRVTGSQLKQVQLLVEADSHNVNLGTKFMFKEPVSINFGFIDMDRWVLGATLNFN